jgi:hypothetical protein
MERQAGEGSLFRTLSGGEFVLHRDVSIRAGVAHTSFQDGTMAYGYSEFKPHCELQVAEIGEEPLTIPAGTYRIGRVLGITHYVTRPGEGVLLLAAAGDYRLQVDATSEWYMFAYHMPLRSPTAPDGLTLICGGAYNYPYYVKYPSLLEMQQSLGRYGTINPS